MAGRKMAGRKMAMKARVVFIFLPSIFLLSCLSGAVGADFSLRPSRRTG